MQSGVIRVGLLFACVLACIVWLGLEGDRRREVYLANLPASEGSLEPGEAGRFPATWQAWIPEEPSDRAALAVMFSITCLVGYAVFSDFAKR